jgi:hypothetical protein
MEKRQRKVKRRQQHLTDCIKGAVKSKSKSKARSFIKSKDYKGRDNISQTEKEHRPKKFTFTFT